MAGPAFSRVNPRYRVELAVAFELQYRVDEIRSHPCRQTPTYQSDLKCIPIPTLLPVENLRNAWA